MNSANRSDLAVNTVSVKELLSGDVLAKCDFSEKQAKQEVNSLTIDSRDVCAGSVFVAMQGVSTHGKIYISQALSNGADLVLLDASDSDVSDSIISVENLEENLSYIAGNFFGHPSRELSLVGFTGTNGKTTCSQLYGQLSSLLERKTGVLGTMGYGVCASSASESQPLVSTGMTTPDAIRTQSILKELLRQGCTHTAIEVSSHGLEQGRVAALRFTTAVFTNLSRDHLDYHETMEAYGEAKKKLFLMPELQHVVINKDDVFSASLLDVVSSDVSVVTYSLSESQVTFYLSDIQFESARTQALLHTPEGEFFISVGLVGGFNLSNLLAVIGALYVEGQTLASIVEKLEQIVPVAGRMESIAVHSNTHAAHVDHTKSVLVDYAHTPDALKNVLLAIREYSDAPLWCVFGCGGDRDTGKRSIMAAVAEQHADHIVVTSDNPRSEDPQKIINEIEAGFLKDTHTIVVDRAAAIEHALAHSSDESIIVIAGKGHEDYQLIGEQKTFFSDQNVARDVLAQLAGGRND